MKNKPPRIRFVGAGDRVKRPQPTLEEIGLKPEMSQFYSLKSTMEQLFVNRRHRIRPVAF
jgi:hypothetical protein